MSFPGNVRIVLVQPETPGNVGSAARAMQTMGLADLVLVDPVCDPHADEAYMLAHSAADVVRQARVVGTLAEALADTVFSVGTTRRTRRLGYPIYTPEETAREIRRRTEREPAAIVFGRESSGLDNPELALCSIQSTIPCATETHSLNLAQAVQVYSYTLYQASLAPADREYQWALASHVEMEHFYAHLQQALLRMGTASAPAHGDETRHDDGKLRGPLSTRPQPHPAGNARCQTAAPIAETGKRQIATDCSVDSIVARCTRVTLRFFDEVPCYALCP
jgi:TrmH family RNA methyltransferase